MNNESNELQTINYPAIDVMRLMLAIIIMTSHCFIFGSSKLFGLSGLLYNRYLARLGVPFFFICTGFFLTKKKDITVSLKKSSRKFARLYVIWSLIYLPIGIYNIIISENKIVTFKNILIQFIYGNYPLWWLEGTAIACLCVLTFYTIAKKKIWFPLIISLGLYVYGSTFYYMYLLKINIPSIFLPFKILQQLFLDPLASVRNGVIFGFVFVSIGIFIAQKELYKKLDLRQWLSIFLISMFIGLAEKFLFYKLEGVEAWTNNIEIFLLIAAPCLFCLMIKLSNKWIEISKYELNTKRIREMSGFIFYTHYFVYFFAQKILELCLPRKSDFFNLILGIAVSIITVCLSKFLLNNNNKCVFLKK